MVYIILGDGFEEIEAIAPCDILRRGGIETAFAAVGDSKIVTGGHGISVRADILTAEIVPDKADTFVVPGGMGGVNSIKADSITMSLIALAAEKGASLAAICAGPSVLAELGLLEGRRITCYPGSEKLMHGALCQKNSRIVNDDGLITGQAPGAAIDFGLGLLARLKDEKTAEKLRMDLVY